MRATSGRGARDTVILDVIDGQGVHDTNSRNSSIWTRQGGHPQLTNVATSAMILDTAAGTVTSATLEGTRWATMTSGAVPTSHGLHTVGSRLGVPVGMDISASPAVWRRPQRYQFIAYLRRAFPLTGNIKFGMIYVFTVGSPPGNFLGDSVDAGFEIISDPTINAGRWTFRVRARNGGAIGTSIDSGVTPAVDHILGYRYDHLLTPRLAALIDGGEFGAVSGVANIPQAAASNEISRPAIVMRVPDAISAGQIDRVGPCRFTIIQLPGFNVF